MILLGVNIDHCATLRQARYRDVDADGGAVEPEPVALAVLGFFTFLHFAESKFIMPLLIGDRMELHPVVIIIVLIVGGEVGGMLIGGQIGSLLGMFFAAPIAAITRVMVRRYWLRMRRSGRPQRALDLARVLPPVREIVD